MGRNPVFPSQLIFHKYYSCTTNKYLNDSEYFFNFQNNLPVAKVSNTDKASFSCKPVKKNEREREEFSVMEFIPQNTLQWKICCYLGKIRLLFNFIIKCIYIPAENIPGTSLLTIMVRTFLSDFKASTAFEN